MSDLIDTKARRAALAPRQNLYVHRVSPGLFVGVRIANDLTQLWTARYRNAEGKQVFKPLGDLAEVGDADRFLHACDLARKFSDGHTNKTSKGRTFSQAVDAYVLHILSKKGQDAADTARRSLALTVQSHEIGGRPLTSLTWDDLSAFRDGLVVPKDDSDEALRRARATASRKWAYIKATLNYCVAPRKWLKSDAEWKDLGSWKNIWASRTLYLTREERIKLLEVAEPDIRAFMRGMLLTSFRPGELAHCRVGDVDFNTGVVNLKKSKTGPRTVVLSNVALAQFKEQARNKTPRAHLYTTDAGIPWTDSNVRNYPTKRAGKAAGLPPEFCLYNLRHTAISAWLEAGLDMHFVSKTAGTSLLMIDKTYGHINEAEARARLGAVSMC
jgi:integrase